MSQKGKPGLSRPPRPETRAMENESQAFIDGAGEKASVADYPWNQLGVRTDMVKLFNLRLPEPAKLKLQWLAERSPKSMHQIALEAVMAEIDRQINEQT